MEEKIIGLLIQTIPYLGKQKILKVFTGNHGLLALLAKPTINAVLTSPFVLAEWVVRPTSHSIYPLNDGTLLDDFGALKENFGRLMAAGQMAKDLLETQLPGKPAAETFALAAACFRKLPLFQEPRLLAAAFRLKLLNVEGMLHEKDLSSPFLQTLGLSRSFQEIAELSFQDKEMDQVDVLFNARIYRS
jgi:recombinational DNA repair protein (RecF pathway)